MWRVARNWVPSMHRKYPLDTTWHKGEMCSITGEPLLSDTVHKSPYIVTVSASIVTFYHTNRPGRIITDFSITGLCLRKIGDDAGTSSQTIYQPWRHLAELLPSRSCLHNGPPLNTGGRWMANRKSYLSTVEPNLHPVNFVSNCKVACIQQNGIEANNFVTMKTSTTVPQKDELKETNDTKQCRII